MFTPIKKKGLTPLENAVDFNPVRKDSFSNGVNRRSLPFKADGGLKPPSAQPVRVQSSLTGFTIVEVLVSSMIFAIAALGIFSTIAAIRKPAAVSERKIVAAYYGRRILDELRAKTDARPGVWNGGALGTAGSLPVTVALTAVTISGTVYNASYTVTDATPASVGAKEVRKVDLTITWTEP